MEKILEIKNLNLGFNTDSGYHQALYDVSYSLEQGKTLALVGESGCGKSVSAMSVLQLLPKNAQITDGEILYSNKNLLDFSPNEMQKIR